jgi:hypothetical protein
MLPTTSPTVVPLVAYDPAIHPVLLLLAEFVDAAPGTSMVVIVPLEARRKPCDAPAEST